MAKVVSEALQSIEDFRKRTLLDLLTRCNPAQREMFGRMYHTKNISAPPEELITTVGDNEMDWAIQQCENTIRKNAREIQ